MEYENEVVFTYVESLISGTLINDYRIEDFARKHNHIESKLKELKEIIVCIAKGFSNKEIADELNISIHTVTTHRRNISSKLQIHSIAGITIYAIANGLVQMSDINIA